MTPQEIQAQIDRLQRAEYVAILVYGAASLKIAVAAIGTGGASLVDGVTVFAAYENFVQTYGNAVLDIDNLKTQLNTATTPAPATTIVNQPTVTFGPFTRPAKSPTLPAPVPVQSDDVDLDGIYENGQTFVINGNSIMVVGTPSVGDANGLKFTGPQSYGPIAPGISPSKLPTKPVNLTSPSGGSQGSGAPGSGVGGTGGSGKPGGTGTPPPTDCAPTDCTPSDCGPRDCDTADCEC
jgi:hypothetical protein